MFMATWINDPICSDTFQAAASKDGNVRLYKSFEITMSRPELELAFFFNVKDCTVACSSEIRT